MVEPEGRARGRVSLPAPKVPRAFFIKSMDKFRTLSSGREVKELDKAITLEVYTKCPEKWMLIDLETEQVYTGSENQERGKQWKLIEK